MPEKYTKRKRLFKVAKELNVTTSELVTYLESKGHELADSPNTKLSGEQYGILLKEFASEKDFKEKAQEIQRKQKAEIRSVIHNQKVPPKVETKVEEEPEEDFLSATELRSGIIERKDQESEDDKPKDEGKDSKEDSTEKETEGGGLKVLGKIDLDGLSKKPVRKKAQVTKEELEKELERKRAEERKKLEAKRKAEEEKRKREEERKRKEEEKRRQEEMKRKEEEQKKRQEEEKRQAELKRQRENKKRKQVDKPMPKDQPKLKQEPKGKAEPKVKQDEKQESSVKPPVKEVKSTEKIAASNEVEKSGAEGENEEVIRAQDHTPALSGLTILGKIDLPGKKKKSSRKDKDKSSDKRKDAKGGSNNKKTDGSADDSTPKKKRRRRRRKRKTTSSDTNNNKQSNQNDSSKGRSRNKKEKPSEKEIKSSIKSTLAGMNRGSSRSRQRFRRAKREADAEKRRQKEIKAQKEAQILEVTEFITANEFANLINAPVTDVIKKSFLLGIVISINQRLDAELLTILAEEYGYELKFIDVTDREFEIAEEQDDPEDLETRDPIITVMGHVDHGKTTLLDYMRKTNVTDQEAGGITQHIGAYIVNLKSGKKITFLDTPGHEAFTAMRARGAKVTDVAIIVVAADDAVMPQTKEAINHAQAAGVPMIFAINKMDKSTADAEKIKGQLAEMNLLVEDWGGKIQSQEISAKFGTNLDELLEKVIFESDLLELKANPDKNSNGTVIEARMEKGMGNVVTMLVQNGTLKVGDPFVAGVHFGKVRALIDQNGDRIKEAGPSMPVQVLGLTGQPQAGDKFQVFDDEAKAKDISQKRQELYREQQMRQTKRITLEEIGRRKAIGNFKELNIIIKADVDGSVEALAGALLKISTDEIQVNIILKGVGGITESDVLLASASDAIIIAFNVRPKGKARSLSEKEGVDIRTYSVIYDAINDVRDAMEGLLSPEVREEVSATIDVRDTFHITRVGMVAGCYVTSGKVNKNDLIRVIRDGVVIHDGRIGSLKRYKDDVKDVAHGFECGIMIDNFTDVAEGDTFETYRTVEVKRTL